MSRVVYAKNEYMVIEDKRGHVIINTKGQYENHAHIKKKSTCKMLIRLMQKEIVPDSNYLKGSALRLTLDDGYKDKVLRKIEKDKSKQRYFNINRGVRK